MKSGFIKNRFGVYFGVLTSVFLCLYFVGDVVAVVDKTQNVITPETVIELVNGERELQGLQKLEEDELLDIVAQNKLQNMIEEEYFAHTSPQGTDPWRWFVKSGYDFAFAGENLAIDYTDVNEQHEAWMNSPKHKKNILDERFTHTGVAVRQTQIDGKNVIITVEVFAKPQSVSVSSSNFTPETYNVPEALFHKGVTKEIPVLEVSAMDVYDANKTLIQKNSNTKAVAWAIVGGITLLVIIWEYRFFKRKRK